MSTLILPFLNFSILIAFIIYKGRTPFFQFLSNRYVSIVEALSQSKKLAIEVQNKEKEITQRLLSLDSLKSGIALEWSERRAQKIDLIKEASKSVIKQIQKEAVQNNASFEQVLGQELLGEFKREVLLKSETKIKQVLSDGVAAQQFVKRFVEGVSRS